MALHFKAPDPEELVHAVGIPTILKCLARYNPLGAASFGTYLYIALRHGYVGWFRSRRRLVVEQAEGEERPAPAEQELDDTVQYILEGLAPYDRALLALRFWEGLTLQEIADAIGCSKTTASGDLQTALKNARTSASRPPAALRGKEPEVPPAL